MPKTERLSAVRRAKGERGIWQRRYWEHTIKNETDYAAHVSYVHINPLKHGLVERVADWPYSSFHRLVEVGIYAEDWAGDGCVDLDAGEAYGGYTPGCLLLPHFGNSP
jgi:putative transposase